MCSHTIADDFVRKGMQRLADDWWGHAVATAFAGIASMLPAAI